MVHAAFIVASVGRKERVQHTSPMERCPKGSPRMAAFLDSDENFMMYRRFGWIQSRLLLNKQNEISDLEKDLELEDGFPPKDEPINGEVTRYEGTSEYKQQILKDLEKKFCEYSQLISAARDMMLMHRPTSSEYRSLRSYCDYSANLSELDEEWVHCKEDLITLRPGREHAWLDRAIEEALRRLPRRIVRGAFCSKETQEKTTQPHPVYYTRGRIEVFAAGVITFMILVLLVVPTYVLYHLTNDIEQGSRTTALCIGILLVFTLAFSAVLSLFTRARRHEILAAAAAYCAVLVVFLGNVPRPGCTFSVRITSITCFW
ncbi:hypothetical protein B0J12DRAFT_89133 [Macrophomina phaseolina]|uniref:DUF6594 domain-containing protein n=1 Tax=Macrophomina phaseolina TaxID=35725 RepID=A0ABQ8GAR4_9PEZI|nr:hypothetical protein B0J12DRAFT_89133 [Macrophomina phaseolina]